MFACLLFHARGAGGERDLPRALAVGDGAATAGEDLLERVDDQAEGIEPRSVDMVLERGDDVGLELFERAACGEGVFSGVCRVMAG